MRFFEKTLRSLPANCRTLRQKIASPVDTKIKGTYIEWKLNVAKISKIYTNLSRLG